MNRNRLYGFLLAACAGGYGWLTITQLSHATVEKPGPNVCLIRSITSIPCPSCGSTRSALAIFSGDLYQALQLNPLGFIIVGILLIAPFWIFRDLISGSSSLWSNYKKTEAFFSRRTPAIIAITLILANWIWNINKAL